MTEVQAGVIRQEKRVNDIQIGKEEVKLSLYANDILLYLRDPKNSTRKLLETINIFRSDLGIQNQFAQTKSLSIHQQQTH